MRRYWPFLVAFLVLAALFIEAQETVSRSFGQCISQWTEDSRKTEPEKDGFIVAEVIGIHSLCVLRAIDRHNGIFAALAAFVIAWFTFTLQRSTDKLFIVTKESADAAKLNAEALIDADRAHLYAVIKVNNLGAALRAAHIADMDDAIASPQPLLQFALRNLGRAAAILEETGWLLTQRERGNQVWQYPVGAIAEPVVDGGAETMPPTDCTLDESVFRVRDAKEAFDGKRPLYFVGYVIFTTSLDRVYEFRWQYENNGTRWVLTHYDERQRSHRPPPGATTGTLTWAAPQ